MTIPATTKPSGTTTIIYLTKPSEPSLVKHDISKSIGALFGAITPAFALFGFVAGTMVGSSSHGYKFFHDRQLNAVVTGVTISVPMALITSLIGVALQLTVDKGIDATLFALNLPSKAIAAFSRPNEDIVQ